MKYFLVLIFTMFGFSAAYAQYPGGVEFYHLPLVTESKQYSILSQSVATEFIGVQYDKQARSLLFTTSELEFVDTISITLNKQTFLELLSTDNAKDPDAVLILVNGIEQPYRLFVDKQIISWKFRAFTQTNEIELVSSNFLFPKGVYSNDDISFSVPVVYPPLKQGHLGISIQNIHCKNDFILIEKYNESPACVTPETKSKLVERGWTS